MLGNSYVPPSALDEQTLILAAQAGDEPATAYLLTQYEPVVVLVRSLLRTLDRRGNNHDDMRSAAYLAILRALKNYDPARGDAKFTSYAFFYVRGAMLNVLYPNQSSSAPDASARLVGLDSVESGDGYSFERDAFKRDKQYGTDIDLQDVLDADRDAAVRRFVGNLAPGQRDILCDVFWADRSHADIARTRGTSRPAVSRSVARALCRGQVELASYRPAFAA